MQIKIKKLHRDAKLPAFAYPTDAGLDLCTVEDVTINPGEFKQVHTGIAIVFPVGYTALVWDKSSVSHIKNIKTMGGVFDSDYRGEYIIGLINLGNKKQMFYKGDKICQLLIQKIEHPKILEVAEIDETDRGEGRCGSTGK